MPDTNQTRFSGHAPFRVFILVVAVALVFALYGLSRMKGPEAVPPAQNESPAPASTAEAAPEIPFRDIAAAAGIDFVHRSGATGEKMLPESGGSGCAFVDYDNDGDADLVLVSGRAWPWDEHQSTHPVNTLALYRNDGEKFANVTSDIGLSADFYGQGVAAGDYDADGNDDLFFTGLGGNRMFRNDAARFVDVTGETGVAGSADDWTTSTGFFDYDRDGDLDLFVCNYLRWTREADQAATRRVPGEGLTYAHPGNFDGVQNYLYRNDGGRFSDVSAEAGIHVTEPSTGKPLGKALAVTFVDFDQDGWLDIFVANDTVRHFLFRNKGNGSFEEVGESRGFALNAAGLTTSGMGIDAAWIRNNSDLAIAVGNFADERTSLYVLHGGSAPFFTDETIQLGIGGPTRNVLTFGLLFDDFDLDSRVDLVQTNGHLEESIGSAQPSQTYKQRAKLFWNAGPNQQPEFVDLAVDKIGDLATPIVGRGLANADVDGDGDLDLVINQGGGPPLLLRNDQQLAGHWLRCRLEGPPGNPHAIGATIELRAAGVTQRRCVNPTRSYLSQTEPVVTFGLGNTDKVDGLAVTWPNGTKQEVKVDRVNQVLKVRPAAEEFIALANTAKAQLENGEFQKAIDLLKRALELRPDSAAMRRNLARAYVLSGQAALAKKELGKLEEQAAQPSAAVAYLSGLAALRELRYDDSVTQLRRAVELDPDEATLHFQLGIALLSLGRTDEAKQQFEKAGQLDPLHGGAQYQLATLARKANDQESFNRLMRDYQRIRAIKGSADPLALEECRYTKPEGPEISQPPPASVGPPAKFLIGQPISDVSETGTLVAFAALALKDTGQYQLVGVTNDGNVLILDFDESGTAHATARSPQPLAATVDDAVILVGNAFVDRQQLSTDAKNDLTDHGDRPEIAIVTPERTWLVRYTPEGQVEDLTASSGLSAAAGNVARWVDLDHDGDIDLCVGSANGLRIWRNNSDGTFVDSTDDFGLADVGPCYDFAAADLDGVNLGTDLIVAGPNDSTLWRNKFGGKLAKDAEVAANWPAAECVFADDFDDDGLPDVLLLSPRELTLIYTGSETQQRLPLDIRGPLIAATIDIDNDGWLDVFVAGRNQKEPTAIVARNTGGRFSETLQSVAIPETLVTSGLLDADLNRDGRTDIALAGGNGRLNLLRNDTPTANNQLKLALRSFVGSPSSIGVRVQVRAGELTVTRWTDRELPVEIGVGSKVKIDSIQTLWLNGIAKNEINVAVTREPLRVTIVEFVRSSSCPFLYAWVDGAWEFVTDLLGTAPLNVAIARDVPMPPDPDELVVLGPAGRFTDGSTAARIRITSELREVVYLEQSRLMAVDHPRDTTVFSRDRVAPTGPIAGPQFVLAKNARAPKATVSSDGLDRTAMLAREDGEFAPPARVLTPPTVGFTEPLSIELDFDDLDNLHPMLLALTGWFKFGNSSTNIAASQRSGLQAIWPRLEAQVADGRWHNVDEMVGFPAGNTKTIVCDLTGKLPRGVRRLRLTTSFEVRWDSIALYDAVPTTSAQVTELHPTKAELHWHGFAELRPESPDTPQVPNLARMSDSPPWRSRVEGWCTCYGGITPLVVRSDGLMAILNSGDAATIEFDAGALPPRPTETARTLLLYTHGWIKEADPNSLADRRVEPLPSSANDVLPTSTDWQLEYNTRWVPANIDPTMPMD